MAGTVGITAHFYDDITCLMMIQDMHRSESQAYTVLLLFFKYCIVIWCAFLKEVSINFILIYFDIYIYILTWYCQILFLLQNTHWCWWGGCWLKEACLMFPDDCQQSLLMKELRWDRTFMSWAWHYKLSSSGELEQALEDRMRLPRTTVTSGWPLAKA